VTWSVAVAGTVHRDDIVTPHGRVSSLGGSAVYFALAASRYVPVKLNGIVGDDCAEDVRALFESHDVNLEGLVVSELPTFEWHAEHSFDTWITSSESEEEGCDPFWMPDLPVASRDADVLFLASMRPSLQRTVREQSRARVVGLDTMTIYTEQEPEAVSAVARRADLLFLNRAELRSLTGDDDWLGASRRLCADGARAMIVKAGPDGALVVTADALIEQAAHPVVTVVDPTGAGDALAGGFLGYCASIERADNDVFPDALNAGLECAAHTITEFGTVGLTSWLDEIS